MCSPLPCNLLSELASTANALACEGPCIPCIPQIKPFAQVTMVTPPPIVLPTKPEPVCKLELPKACKKVLTPAEEDRFRFANFYNNFGKDYRNDGCWFNPEGPKAPPNKKTVPPGCDDYRKRPLKPCEKPGCPTGYLPCKFRMIPPPGCDPHLPWIAIPQKCPPKPRIKQSLFYTPGPCCRPGCQHVKLPCCEYPDCCKAHCYECRPEVKAIWWENFKVKCPAGHKKLITPC